MILLIGIVAGLGLFTLARLLLAGFYTVSPTQRAVITTFGRAHRLSLDQAEFPWLDDADRERYRYPAVEVVGPGGPYFKWPWQRVHKVDVATQAVDLTWDPTKTQSSIEAVTKDNLTTGIRGQIRYRISEKNLYAYVFGVQSPLEHVMGYFVSILRERVATLVDPKGGLIPAEPGDSGSAVDISEGVSINDLRKNLPKLNQFMEEQCRGTTGRYGIELDAALITEIDPPAAVDRALAAINSTRNQVAADISTARADADQQITLSKRAVEIASNNAQADVAPIAQLAETLLAMKGEGGPRALDAYLRNMRVPLLARARRIVRSADTEGSR